MLNHKILFIITCLTLFCLGIPKSAKADWHFFKSSDQDTPETAKIIKNPLHIQRHFGALNAKNDLDFFTFNLKEGESLPFFLAIPTTDKNFRPMLTVFGPDLPKPKQEYSFSIGDSNGAFSVSDERLERSVIDEPFIFTSFYDGIRMDFTAPKNATYALAISTPDGNIGRYMLKIGTVDKWNWEEIFDRLYGVIRAMLRLY